MTSLKIRGSKLLSQTLKAKERIIVHQGGTSSTKTYSILQAILTKALSEQCLVSVVSESLPHLKRGAMRDFINILKGCDIYSLQMHNMSDNSFDIGNSRVEFFGADQPDKLRGARRDYLFINECNNVNKEVFNQLEVRTNKQVYLDFNPTNEFWLHTEILPLPNVLFIKSNYLDNPFLDDSIIKSIERRKELDPNWWKVFGLGELGSNEGVIFQSVTLCQLMPAQIDCKWIAYGLDFGYSNDPTSLIKCALSKGELFFDEIIFRTGLTNSDIHDLMKHGKVGMSDIVADSADPKSIEELRRRGWNISGAVKGQNSIMTGIDLLKQYRLNVTASSVNLIKEFRNYSWKIDKATSKYINEPMDTFNHGIDAVRYCVMSKLTKREVIIY